MLAGARLVEDCGNNGLEEMSVVSKRSGTTEDEVLCTSSFTSTHRGLWVGPRALARDAALCYWRRAPGAIGRPVVTPC